LKPASQTKGFVVAARRLFFWTLFSLLFFAAALYVTGNGRNFTEKTQVMLLNIVLYTGLFLAACVLLDFVFSAGLALFKRKTLPAPPSFVFLMLGLAAFVFSGLAAAILVLTTGNLA
jgi:hypothetical protein